jgi:curved DNA-binding protein CbpA
MQEDFYDVLGVTKDADPEVIIAAYRALAKKYHPDSGKTRGTGSPERFRQIQEAYETLSDASRRASYDDARRNEGASQRSSQKAPQQEQPPSKGQRADHKSEKPSPKAPPGQPDPPSAKRNKSETIPSELVSWLVAIGQTLVTAFLVTLATLAALLILFAFGVIG